MSDNNKPPLPPPSDTIYFLKTAKPHLHDFSFIGPFHCLEAMVPSLRNKLQQESPEGLIMFDEMMTTGPNALSGFEYIIAPLPGKHTLTITLVKMRNAEVAEKLPGPVWVVCCGEGEGSTKLKDMTVCGAFLSAEKANEALRLVVADKLRGKPEGRKLEFPSEGGSMMCMAKLGNKVWLLESRYDSGKETFLDPEPGSGP